MKPNLLFSLLLLLPLSLSATPKSGYEYLAPETRTMQDDEFENPGMVGLELGREEFHKPGEEGGTCAGCHGDDGSKLNPKAIAAYPVYSKGLDKPITLRDRIHICWDESLGNFPMLYNDKRALYLETFVRNLARGEKVNVDIEGPLKPFYEKGKKTYRARYGQMGMACYHCHDYFPGRMIRGQRLSEGHTNGFPLYRLGTGKLTSLDDRLQECFRSLRAEVFEKKSEIWRNLEVYLNARGNGLKIETPAVRF